MGTRRIPDGQPMSYRTMVRRRHERGEIMTFSHPTLPLNHDFFKSWSDDLAYIMGLIWTDGCLTGRGDIMFSSADLEQAETFSRLTGRNSIRPIDSGASWRCAFRCPQFLIDQGLTPRKSLTLQWPTSMPDEHSGAFMRGVYDGDGSYLFHKRRPGQQAPDLQAVVITASQKFAVSVADWMSGKDIQCKVYVKPPIRVKMKSTIYTVNVLRQESLRKLYHQIYPTPSVPSLTRKRVRFDEWMTTPRGKAGRRKQVAA